MNAVPVIEVLPIFDLGQELLIVEVGEIERSVELVERSLLNPLDFAIEMRLAWFDGPSLDPAAGQFVLEFVAGELGAIIGLDALDGEGHLFL